MTGPDFKAELQLYLQRGRESLLWKLDGLSEYDVRRPMTATGTNLLGLVKHVASWMWKTRFLDRTKALHGPRTQAYGKTNFLDVEN